ncbi:MAG: Oxidoreductase, aldo/keto reductase family [Parcubacteria group bacterium GW2011_GWA2_51_10]|nr:MAG: Oxidoreductase, aldo/keto reductase family [Parcubacteria group bacterium GW2011_GWA2_51_10]
MGVKLPQRILGRTGLSVSCIGLGTAEIGYTYGIGPRTVPTEEDVIALLHRAVELGVTFIDTARFYGEAEERIGKSGILKAEGVLVSTKCGHVLDRGGDMSEAELARRLEAEVDESLRKLKLDEIALVQVHGGTVERIRDGSIICAMQELKDSGKVRFVGISTRGEEAPLAAIESGFFDTLQLAHSILDRRMVVRVLPEAQKKNIGVINRSVLLKGALTSASKYLSPELAPLKQASDKAGRIAAECGMDLPELAVRFALSNPSVHTVLVGSNKVKNIESAVRSAAAGPLPEDILERLLPLAIEDAMQIDPKYWPADMVSDAKDGKKV